MDVFLKTHDALLGRIPAMPAHWRYYIIWNYVPGHVYPLGELNLGLLHHSDLVFTTGQSMPRWAPVSAHWYYIFGFQNQVFQAESVL